MRIVNSKKQVAIKDPWVTETNQKVDAAIETVVVPIHDKDNSKDIRIGVEMNAFLQKKLREFLKEYADVFVWTHDYMPGTNPKIASHQFNVQPPYKPVSQQWHLLIT